MPWHAKVIDHSSEGAGRTFPFHSFLVAGFVIFPTAAQLQTILAGALQFMCGCHLTELTRQLGIPPQALVMRTWLASRLCIPFSALK